MPCNPLEIQTVSLFQSIAYGLCARPGTHRRTRIRRVACLLLALGYIVLTLPVTPPGWGIGASARASDSRVAVPDPAARAASIAHLRTKVFAREYASESEAGRRKLAALLLEKAGTIDAATTDRYVLYAESMRLASLGGDARTALQALTEGATVYRIDPVDLSTKIASALPVPDVRTTVAVPGPVAGGAGSKGQSASDGKTRLSAAGKSKYSFPKPPAEFAAGGSSSNKNKGKRKSKTPKAPAFAETPQGRFLARIKELLAEADRLIAADRYDFAFAYVHVAHAQAEKAGLDRLTTYLAGKLANVQALRAARVTFAADYERMAAVKPLLEGDPKDGVAHQAIGRVICFAKGDWQAGLPHLAQAMAPGLQRVAQQELGPGRSGGVAEQEAIGKAWWALAKQEPEAEVAKRMRWRSAFWYEMCAGRLKDEARKEAEARLAVVEKELTALGADRPGWTKRIGTRVPPFDSVAEAEGELGRADRLFQEAINLELDERNQRLEEVVRITRRVATTADVPPETLRKAQHLRHAAQKHETL